MNQNLIQTFPKDTYVQVNAYLDTLHSMLPKETRLVLSFGNGRFYYKCGNTAIIKNNFKKWFLLDNNSNKDCFITLNSFNPFKNGKPDFCNLKSEKNLSYIDCLMFDIDINEKNALYNENQFIEELFKIIQKNQFPLPNGFSYTGSGGIHLYYSIEPVSYTMKKGIKSLKYIIAKKLNDFVRECNDSLNTCYTVDTRVFDNVRNDRIAGTINPKTGNMCIFFKVNIPVYTFRQLLGFENIDIVDWDKYLKAAKEAFSFSKDLDINNYFYTPAKRSVTVKHPFGKDTFKPIARKRVESILAIGKDGYDFKGHRETSCFALRQMCRQADFTEQEEIDALHALNEFFHEPLEEAFLLNHTDSPNDNYRFTDVVLAQYIGLDIESDMWQKYFNTKTTYEARRKLTQKESLTANRFVVIANIMSQNEKIKNNEIVEITGFPIDAVKRIHSRLKRNPESIEKWKNLDCSDSDNYDFIKMFLTKNKLYIRK